MQIQPHQFLLSNFSPSILQWSSLQIKEGQRRIEFRLVDLENCKMHLTSKVWPGDLWEDSRSCALPLYNLVQIFPRAYYSDYHIWRALSKNHQMRQYPDPRPRILLIGIFSAIRPALAYDFDESKPTLVDATHSRYLDIYYFYHLKCLCTDLYYLSNLVSYLFTKS